MDYYTKWISFLETFPMIRSCAKVVSRVQRTGRIPVLLRAIHFHIQVKEEKKAVYVIPRILLFVSSFPLPSPRSLIALSGYTSFCPRYRPTVPFQASRTR